MKAKTLYIVAKIEGNFQSDQETVVSIASLYKKYGARSRTSVITFTGSPGQEVFTNVINTTNDGPTDAQIGVYLVGHGNNSTGFASYTPIQLATMLNGLLVTAQHEAIGHIRKICIVSCAVGKAKVPVEGNPSYLETFVNELHGIGIHPKVAGYCDWISVGFPLSWVENNALNFPYPALKALTTWGTLADSLDGYKITKKTVQATSSYSDEFRNEQAGKKIMRAGSGANAIRYFNRPIDETSPPTQNQLEKSKKVVYVYKPEENGSVLVSTSDWTDKDAFNE